MERCSKGSRFHEAWSSSVSEGQSRDSATVAELPQGLLVSAVLSVRIAP